MDIVQPYLRTQTDLLTEIKTKMRVDAVTPRWTDEEIKIAINEALMTWHEQVLFPHVYTIVGGWIAGTYEYALPGYVRPPLRPQLRRQVPFFEDAIIESATHTWQVLPGWETEPDGSGGVILRLVAPPRTQEGRVIFHAPNSRIPTGDTLPVTSAQIDDDDTSVTLTTAVDVDDVGAVKIDSEVIFYFGIDRGASTTTLNNLLRGQYDTTAATHVITSDVEWCVAMDDMRLNKLLFDQVRSYLHAYFITDGAAKERSNHEKAIGYYDQIAANFWPTYSPKRPDPKVKLSRKKYILR